VFATSSRRSPTCHHDDPAGVRRRFSRSSAFQHEPRARLQRRRDGAEEGGIARHRGTKLFPTQNAPSNRAGHGRSRMRRPTPHPDRRRRARVTRNSDDQSTPVTRNSRFASASDTRPAPHGTSSSSAPDGTLQFRRASAFALYAQGQRLSHRSTATPSKKFSHQLNRS
jgi:hypothetical protein